MPTDPKQAGDIAKVHGEILQLVNQRVALSTAAISAVCVVLAWVTPKALINENQSIHNYVFFVTTFLYILLGMIYWLSCNMKINLRILSSYLIAARKSNWEIDWRNYRSKFTIKMYTYSQTALFLILGIIISIYPLVLLCCYKLSLIYLVGWNIHYSFAVIYFIAMMILRHYSNDSVEDDFIKNWKVVIASRNR